MASNAMQFSNTAVTGTYKKPKDEEEATALMATLRTRSENRKCFDCPASTPEWCSIPFGIFLCLECCGRHRGMGVHISFMKSATMDAWRPDEAYRMSKGGNGAAAEYFRQHGLNEAKNRYTSMAAQMYKKRLDKLITENSGDATTMNRTGSDPELARQASSGSPNTPVTVTSGFVASSPVGDKPTSGSTILSFNNTSNSSGISSPTGATSNNNTTVPIAISTTKVSLIGKKPTATGKTALAKKKGLGLGGLGVQRVDKLDEASGMAVPRALIEGEDETTASDTTTSSGIRGSNDAPKRVKTLGGGTSSFTTTTTSASSSSYGNNNGMGGGGGPAPVVYRTGNYSGGGPDYGGIGSSPSNEGGGGGGGDGFRDLMFGIGQSFQSLKKKADSVANATAQMLDEA